METTEESVSLLADNLSMCSSSPCLIALTNGVRSLSLSAHPDIDRDFRLQVLAVG